MRKINKLLGGFMKLNLALIRTNLLNIEAHPPGRFAYIDENFGPQELNYHLNLLLEANYISGNAKKSASGAIVVVFVDGITLSGYEFLDSLRDESRFKKIIEKLDLTKTILLPSVVEAIKHLL